MMTKASSRRLVPWLTLPLVALLGACGDGTGKRDIALSECRLPRFAQPAQCGMLEVPEDRRNAGGRKITLFVAVLPANTLSPKPDPLFVLAGGPGQAASQLAPFAAQLNAIRRTRDLVLVDQRGTGRSSPLECAAFAANRLDPFVTDPLPQARACVAELGARGVDAAQYTTSAWVADLDAVRSALGYARVNLWGGSYGSRVALEYLRRHPERVRTMVLDSVVPPSMRITLDVWRTREAALDDVVAACRRSPACAAAHPDPAATLAAIVTALPPAGRKVTLADPRTGESTDVNVTFDFIVAALQPLTYAPEFAGMIPQLLDLAQRGDYAPLFATVDIFTANLAEQMNAALHYSVTCAEDVPRIDAKERALAKSQLRAGALANRVIDVCDVWPRGEMPADLATPVRSDVPVLLLSGALDPVTPPAYADEVAQSLPNSRRVVAGGLGHIVSTHGCAPRLIASFVDAGGFDAISRDCPTRLEAGARPPLWPDRLAPKP